MHLLSQVHDSNIIRRAGMEGQKWAMQQARDAIDHDLADLEDMDGRFIARNISPGGSADLLAVTYFLHFLENS